MPFKIQFYGHHGINSTTAKIQWISERTAELDQPMEVQITKVKKGGLLCWRGDFTFVPTDKEKLYFLSRLLEIRFDQGRPLEDLGYRQKGDWQDQQDR